MNKTIINFKLLSTLLFVTFVFFSCDNSEVTDDFDIKELTISDIHQAYEHGSLTSEGLVLQYLNRVEEIDSTTNAISIINQNAIKVAKALDQEYKRTKTLRPLHGIPLIVKDNINTKNLPTTGGSLALIDFVPKEDAFIIKKLKDAGAIIIAKSNMAEWAFSAKHTESSTHGTTYNPYNIDYVPAGSSGGTAAAIASNMAVLGLGTDTGNSIRGPSAHCSLVGFRTTIGLISRSDIIPLILRNDVVGPMCRTVEDATKVLEVIASYDPSDPITKYAKGKIPPNYSQYLNKKGLKGAKIGVLRNINDQVIDEEIKVIFDQALTDLESLGAIVHDSIHIPNFAKLKQNQWCAEFRQDLEKYLQTYVKNDSIRTLEDIKRIGTTSAYAKKTLDMFSKNNGRFENPEIDCLNAYEDQLRIAFREAIEKVMDSLQLDAIVYPSWNNKPARIDFFEEEYLGDNNQIIAPHTGQPAFTVPMGFTTGNLPAGIQFLGRMFSEPTLISLAYSYEQGTMHRVPPKKMNE